MWFHHYESGKILFDLRGQLLKEKNALVDLDHGVSFVGSNQRLDHGDGEYKVKIDGKDPPSQILLHDTLESKI